MVRLRFALFAGVALCLTDMWADDKPKAAGDLVRTKLDKAKATYEANIDKHRETAATWFDKRDGAAREKGDKKSVDLIKAERRAFDERGELPKSAPAALRSQLAAARASLEGAYHVAIREYTRSKLDDAATTVEKELEAFQSRAGSLAAVSKFGGRWEGTYSNSRGNRGRTVLALDETANKYTGTWDDAVVTEGRRVDRDTIKLAARSKDRSYGITIKVTGGGVMHLTYDAAEAGGGVAYTGTATLERK